jgi:hypothetical protein
MAVSCAMATGLPPAHRLSASTISAARASVLLNSCAHAVNVIDGFAWPSDVSP